MDQAELAGVVMEADHFYENTRPEERVILCTGNQAEPLSSMSKIGRRNHPHVEIVPGDSVIFSSSVIPGNGASIGALRSALKDQGAVIYRNGDPVPPQVKVDLGQKPMDHREQLRKWFTHVSGHPSRGELKQFYSALQPDSLITMHGTHAHMLAHEHVAAEVGIEATLAPDNGTLVQITDAGPVKVGRIPCDVMILEGEHSTPQRVSWDSIKATAAGATPGPTVAVMALVTVVLGTDGNLLHEPTVSLQILSRGADKKVLHANLEEVVEMIPGACDNILSDTTAWKRVDRWQVRDLLHEAVLSTMSSHLGMDQERIGLYVHVQTTPAQVVP